MDKLNIRKVLGSLTEAELVEVFYDAFSNRKREIGGCIDDAYVIGNASYDPDGTGALVGISALPVVAQAKATELLQDGFCENCKVEIQCIAKEAICPICSSVVDCT